MTPRPASYDAAHPGSTTPSGILAALLVAVLSLSACSSAGPDERAGAGATPAPTPSATSATSANPTTPAAPPATPAAAPKAAAPVTITMADFAYALPSSVPAGSEVTVVNKDGEAHTFTLAGTPAVRLVVPPRGGSATFTAPSRAGTYPVVCEFHGGMTAALVVA